jgi:hypothetical protein
MLSRTATTVIRAIPKISLMPKGSPDQRAELDADDCRGEERHGPHGNIEAWHGDQEDKGREPPEHFLVEACPSSTKRCL